jgi:hypothetical protein
MTCGEFFKKIAESGSGLKSKESSRNMSETSTELFSFYPLHTYHGPGGEKAETPGP